MNCYVKDENIYEGSNTKPNHSYNYDIKIITSNYQQTIHSTILTRSYSRGILTRITFLFLLELNRHCTSVICVRFMTLNGFPFRLIMSRLQSGRRRITTILVSSWPCHSVARCWVKAPERKPIFCSKRAFNTRG